MNTCDAGGPAFPVRYEIDDGSVFPCDGMTLRDYFAAKAMAGAFIVEVGRELTCAERAEFAYRQADAMLKARSA